MEANNARAILRSFEAVRPAPTAITVTKWRWAEGVHVFPEAVCPFCKVVMRSTCIWQVNEAAQRLDRITKPSDGQLIEMPREHPHAHSSGAICMNGHVRGTPGADSVAVALFVGIYPQSNLMAGSSRDSIWDEWFGNYFGHYVHDATGLRRRNRKGLGVRLGVRKSRAKATPVS